MLSSFAKSETVLHHSVDDIKRNLSCMRFKSKEQNA